MSLANTFSIITTILKKADHLIETVFLFCLGEYAILQIVSKLRRYVILLYVRKEFCQQ